LPVCGGGEAAEAGFVGGGVSALAGVAGVAGTASDGVFLVGAVSVGVDREGACSAGAESGSAGVASEDPPPAWSVMHCKKQLTHSLRVIEALAEQSMLQLQALF